MTASVAARSLALALSVAWISPSARADTRVVLVEPDPARSEDFERRAFQQLKAELAASGYTLELVRTSEEPEGLAPEALAEPSGARAVVMPRRTRHGLLVELWTRPRSDEPAELATARADGRDAQASRTLALRTVEILRGRGLSVTEEAEARTSVREWEIGVGLGLALLVHPSGLPSSFAPCIIVDYRVASLRLELRLLSAAKSELRAPEGEATLEQTLALAGVRLEPLHGRALSPFLGVVGGAYALGGEARAVHGLDAKSDVVWAAAAGFGVGASYRVESGQAVALDLFARADALWLVPAPVVTVLDRPIARGGQPTFDVAMGVEVVF